MYAIVSQVVIPAMTSVRTLEPRSEILKNRSSPPVPSAAGSLTSWSCLVSDTRPPSLGRAAGRAPGGRREQDRAPPWRPQDAARTRSRRNAGKLPRSMSEERS